MSAEQEDDAEEWITSHKPEFLPHFMAFKIKDDGIFPASMFQPQVLAMYKDSPGKWWQLMGNRTAKKNTLPTEFCQYFQHLLSCPPSSASIERIFSTFGLVWTKLRNRLGVDKATKLVQIHRFLHLASPPVNSEEIEEME